MSVLVSGDTRVLVQGMTGRAGRFYTHQAMRYGTSYVAGVNPAKAGSEHLGLPVFGTVAEAARDTDANASTRERLLRAALQVFAERGYEAATIREICGRAGANVAAVHYHFGGKIQLFQAVFERRVGDINRERLRLLAEAEASAGTPTAPPPSEPGAPWFLLIVVAVVSVGFGIFASRR